MPSGAPGVTPPASLGVGPGPTRLLGPSRTGGSCALGVLRIWVSLAGLQVQ